MCKQDLALNNLQWLICHETKPNQTRILLNFLLTLVFYNLLIISGFQAKLLITNILINCFYFTVCARNCLQLVSYFLFIHSFFYKARVDYFHYLRQGLNSCFFYINLLNFYFIFQVEELLYVDLFRWMFICNYTIFLSFQFMLISLRKEWIPSFFALSINSRVDWILYLWYNN